MLKHYYFIPFMIDSLESSDSDLECIKILLWSNCWSEDEKLRGWWLEKGDRESLISLCQFLRNEVLSNIQSITNHSSLEEAKKSLIRFNTINGCIFLFRSPKLLPLTLSWELKKLSTFVLNANRAEEEVARFKREVWSIIE